MLLSVRHVDRLSSGRLAPPEPGSFCGRPASPSTSDADGWVDKLCGSCRFLRDGVVATIVRVEQLTYLPLLKMAHERETRLHERKEVLAREIVDEPETAAQRP